MLAVLAMLARGSALRVALGGSAPPNPSAARRGPGIARSGQESRCADRTGKLALGQSRLHDGVALRIERDRCHGRPVPGLAAPASWVGLACLLVEFVPRCEHGTILSGVALRRRHVSDTAVAVFSVVPTDEACGPLPRRIEFGEASDRKLRPVFGGAEQCFSIRIVIADAWPRVRRFDAEPM